MSKAPGFPEGWGGHPCFCKLEFPRQFLSGHLGFGHIECFQGEVAAGKMEVDSREQRKV